MIDNIEKQVAEAILQKTREIRIGQDIYQVAPPTTMTLIMASELISTLPKWKLDNEKILSESLCIAKDCRFLGDILAILILGAKGARGTKEVVRKRFFGLIKEKMTVEVDHIAPLSEKLLGELSPAELNEIMAELFRMMQIADFFGLTTSLLEINLLRRTREVGETTASGR